MNILSELEKLVTTGEAVFDIGNGESVKAHINTTVGVNTYMNDQWTGFYECSLDLFEATLRNIKAKLSV